MGIDARRARQAVALLVFLAACDASPALDAGVDAGGSDAGVGRDGSAEDAGSDAGLPPLRDDAVEPAWRWDEQAARIIDRSSLADSFAASGYLLPTGASLYIARIVDGVDQPAYELYEAGGGAFTVDFWPASTIKLLAAVAALELVGARGFTGAATMTWDSGYSDVLASIIDRALRDSSNADYDRTLRVSGLDWLNTDFLTAERGFPSVVITSSYGGLPVRDIPGLTLSEGTSRDFIPARTTTGDYGRNDTDLFDLVEGLRRVLQHQELPAAHRFALGDADVARLREALCGSSVKYFRTGASSVLGVDASVCNKYGYVPTDECLDQALIESADGAERYLLAAVIPATSCDARLNAIAEQTLRAVRAMPERTPLQLDAGVPIVVQVDDLGSDGATRRLRFTIDAPGADRLLFSLDEAEADELGAGPRFTLERGFVAGGEALAVVRAFAGTEPVGYRALRVGVPAP